MFFKCIFYFYLLICIFVLLFGYVFVLFMLFGAFWCFLVLSAVFWSFLCLLALFCALCLYCTFCGFYFFVRAESFRKKKEFKIALITSFILLLPKTVNEEKFISSQSLTFILIKNSGYSKVL